MEATNDTAVPQTESKRSRRSRQNATRFGRICHVLARVFAVILLATGTLLFVAYRTAQRVPEFYQSVLAQPQAELEIAGDDFETKVVDLQMPRGNQGIGK